MEGLLFLDSALLLKAVVLTGHTEVGIEDRISKPIRHLFLCRVYLIIHHPYISINPQFFTGPYDQSATGSYF